MESIILLHGALGSKAQLEALSNLLGKRYQVHLLDFVGHGGRSLPTDGFTMQELADELVQFIQDKQLTQPHVFGYSMGGFAAMLACRQQPHLLGKLITLATKYYWDTEIAAKESKMLQPEIVAAKVPKFAEVLANRHSPTDWKQLMLATAAMMQQLGANIPLQTEDYATISNPCLLMLGDRDKMVTLEETRAVYQQLPNAQLAVLPNTPHPIEQVEVGLVAYTVERFVG